MNELKSQELTKKISKQSIETQKKNKLISCMKNYYLFGKNIKIHLKLTIMVIVLLV